MGDTLTKLQRETYTDEEKAMTALHNAHKNPNKAKTAKHNLAKALANEGAKKVPVVGKNKTHYVPHSRYERKELIRENLAKELKKQSQS